MRNLILLYFYFFTAFCFGSGLLFGQDERAIRKQYEGFAMDDEKAIPLVQKFIQFAKKKNDDVKLTQAYKDAVYFANKNDKLKYADSCVVVAERTLNRDLIASAYVLKGSIYYFNFRKYRQALDEYLKAYDYGKDSEDQYLKYKIIYHLGIVKSYLGYYNEALIHFEECINYFEPNTRANLHPNEIYNNKKGYLNSINQSIKSYRHLMVPKVADSLIVIGLQKTENQKDFVLERSYFLQNKGISEFDKKNYQVSIENLKESLPKILQNDDIASTSVGYFFLGKNYMDLKQDSMAYSYFRKVDSLFTTHDFMLPELRENYEILINYAKKNDDSKQQLIYINSLLKADSLVNNDYKYLSSKLHKRYDTQTLLEEKTKLENEKTFKNVIFTISGILISGLIFLLYKRNRREKKIIEKYQLLQQKIKQEEEKEKDVFVEEKLVEIPISTQESVKQEVPVANESSLNEEVVNELLQKLNKFEKEKHYLEKGITLNKLAKKFNTNTNYLSQVINENKHLNFSKYLAELRISYITKELNRNPKMLNYSIETLATECGIASRQNFSDLFQEVNGLRPIDFINQRKKELKNEK